MKVLRVEQYKAPFVKEIDPGLESMQHEVDGWIQAVYPFEDPVAIICNEEGKLNGMELCRALRDENGEVYDIVPGAFFICGLTSNDFGSISDELAAKFSELFRYPEMYVRAEDNEVFCFRLGSDEPPIRIV